TEKCHPVSSARLPRRDESAGERPQKAFVEAEDGGRPVVIDRGAHLQRRPQRGAAAEIVGRGKIEVDRINRHRRRYRARRKKGKTSRFPLKRNVGRRLQIAVADRGCLSHGRSLFARGNEQLRAYARSSVSKKPFYR